MATTARNTQVRLETDAHSIKAAVLGLALPRYRAMREAIGVDEPIRIILDSMLLTPDRRLLYVKSSKVAGTSMKLMLDRYAASVGGGPVLHSNAHWRDYVRALEERPGIVFALCREPVDRFLSAFRDFLVARRNPYRFRHDTHFARLGYSPDRDQGYNLDVFIDYVEQCLTQSELYTDRHWRKQVHNLAHGHIEYDLIGRVEALEADVARVLEMAGIPPGGLVTVLGGKLNNTDGAERFAPSLAQRQRIETLYADDFEAFGY